MAIHAPGCKDKCQDRDIYQQSIDSLTMYANFKDASSGFSSAATNFVASDKAATRSDSDRHSPELCWREESTLATLLRASVLDKSADMVSQARLLQLQIQEFADQEVQMSTDIHVLSRYLPSCVTCKRVGTQKVNQIVMPNLHISVPTVLSTKFRGCAPFERRP